MKSAAILSLVLASAAVAQPPNHRFAQRHAHQRAHQLAQKRDVVTSWTTAWETVIVTEVIDETMTTWITPGAKDTPTSTTTSTSTMTSTITTSTQVPGRFFETSSSIAPPPAPTTTPVVPVVAPAPSPSEALAPVNSPAVESPAPAVITTSTAPQAAATGSGSGGSAPSGQTFTGKMTYYDLAMGSCGVSDLGKDYTTNIVAINSSQMGALANDNPMCGKTITISFGGQTTTALVHDKCPGCGHGDIDVSRATFIALTGEAKMNADGHETVEWWFNS